LFSVPDPDQGEDFKAFLNPNSLVVVTTAFVEPGIRADPPGTRYQFERLGYFISDPVDSSADALVFNRTVTLRDSWAKESGASKVDEGRPVREKRAGAGAGARAGARVSASEKSAELRRLEGKLIASFGLDAVDADILTRDAGTAEFFEAAVDGGNAKAVAKLMINQGQLPWADLPFGPKHLASLVVLVEDGTISATAAKEVLAAMVESGGEPKDVVERLGLGQISDAGAIAPIVQEIVAANPDKAAAYRGGRAGLLGFFVGQVMSRTGGRANPEMVKNLVEKQLA
jgi:glutaminyl-tRNA synthetase